MESLNLFSIKGFDAVSIRDIAKVVGIKESSIYNHYKSKQDIFDCILVEFSARGEAFFHQMQVTGDDMEFAVDERTINLYKNMTPDQFAWMSKKIFTFYFADEINVKLRKMLTIEQYRNEKIAKLYREISFDRSIEYQAQLFDALIKEDCLIKTDPYLLAISFFAPIFLIFYKFDDDMKGLSEAKELFEKHIRHFNEVYGKKK